VWSRARCRYLLLEFPALARAAPPLLVAELGCGCGSSLLPVLKANPAARALATDLSPAAVRRHSGRRQAAGCAPFFSCHLQPSSIAYCACTLSTTC